MQPSGPMPADIMIVGEAPGAEEERIGLPFVGASGRVLTDLLHGAGLIRSACFITNVARHRPPKNDITKWFADRKTSPDPTWVRIRDLWVHPHVASGVADLTRELRAARPKTIIALGGVALWALTGQRGILKWRGSRLWSDELQATVVPSVHPAATLRQPSMKTMLWMDIRRAAAISRGEQQPRTYRFTTAPTFHEANSRLDWLLERADDFPLSCDIETRLGHTACIGYAWTEEDAICIPILQQKGADPFYWMQDEEQVLRHKMYRLFHRPNILWVGQNFLYDCQYFVREGMGYPRRVFDTMIGHHALYSNMRKGLDFLSSMYARDHIYWKDESKDWDPHLGETQLWTYNCKDACITLECYNQIKEQQKKESAK